MEKLISIKNLHTEVGGKEILKGVDLDIKSGRIEALMGPNGSGKSTLAQVLAGHPNYEVTKGDVTLRQAQGDSINLLELTPDERAKAGLFLAFQYPAVIPGVSLGNLLRQAYNIVKQENLTPIKFKKYIQAKLDLLKIDDKYLERSVNDGFSGGEKKKAEILQMAVLEPKLAILDETDSGLDVDALKVVAEGVKTVMQANPEMSVLIITHYQRILDHIKPDHVHIMQAGQIIKSGDHKLAEELEKTGYKKFLNMKDKIQTVDENDNIIGHKDRNNLDKNDIYRVAALWIINDQGEALLAQRGFNKHHDPGKWGPAVAGTEIDEGETYESNIIKEAEEELGLKNIQPKKENKERIYGKHNHFTQWFSLGLSKPLPELIVQEDEVEQIKWFSQEELASELEKHPDRFLNGMDKWFEKFMLNK